MKRSFIRAWAGTAAVAAALMLVASSRANAVCEGLIGNFVWNDGMQGVAGECDGLWPLDGSNGLNGIVVRLWDQTTGELIRTTTTGASSIGTDGYYVFDKLCAGLYRVEVDTPPGFIPAPSQVCCDPVHDSNGSPAIVQLVGDADQNYYVDFGFCTPKPREGCSAGFWKNHVDAWIRYSPDRTVGSVFGGVTVRFGALASARLDEALTWGGGPQLIDAARLLLHQATAALLSATNPNVSYPRSEASVLSDTNAKLVNGTRGDMLKLKDAFDQDNNSGCPLSGRASGGTK